jgi:hypothetical protein
MLETNTHSFNLSARRDIKDLVSHISLHSFQACDDSLGLFSQGVGCRAEAYQKLLGLVPKELANVNESGKLVRLMMWRNCTVYVFALELS